MANGDLILRAELLELFTHKCCGECCGCEYEEKEKPYYCGLIKTMPAIDAIPVEWLEHMKTAITLTRFANSIKDVLALWKRFGSKEQEAR